LFMMSNMLACRSGHGNDFEKVSQYPFEIVRLLVPKIFLKKIIGY
jgi:hypothetical protein